jgi:hypothetical protein
MKRYSIMARGRHSDHEVELCQCDSNPQAVVAAAQAKTILIRGKSGGRKIRVAMYGHVYAVDNLKRKRRPR